MSAFLLGKALEKLGSSKVANTLKDAFGFLNKAAEANVDQLMVGIQGMFDQIGKPAISLVLGEINSGTFAARMTLMQELIGLVQNPTTGLVIREMNSFLNNMVGSATGVVLLGKEFNSLNVMMANTALALHTLNRTYADAIDDLKNMLETINQVLNPGAGPITTGPIIDPVKPPVIDGGGGYHLTGGQLKW
jgi:hypothetical protein